MAPRWLLANQSGWRSVHLSDFLDKIKSEVAKGRSTKQSIAREGAQDLFVSWGRSRGCRIVSADRSAASQRTRQNEFPWYRQVLGLGIGALITPDLLAR
jgi:hypothetical protein